MKQYLNELKIYLKGLNRRRSRSIKALFNRIVEEAHRDGLTGILNREGFEYRADRLIKKARKNGIPISYLAIDGDGLKQVNDGSDGYWHEGSIRHEHQAGDGLIIDIAGALESSIRSGDVLGRMGGDEYGILLFDADKKGAEAVAERINRVTRLKTGGKGVSIGVACSTTDDLNLETLTKYGEKALYAAKEAGRNTYRVHTPNTERKTV